VLLSGLFYQYIKVKVKVKLSLCLTKHHATKTYRGMTVRVHVFVNSALNGGEWCTYPVLLSALFYKYICSY